jgi:hypothetical protein
VGSSHQLLEGAFQMFQLPRSGTFDGTMSKTPFEVLSFQEIMEEESKRNQKR